MCQVRSVIKTCYQNIKLNFDYRVFGIGSRFIVVIGGVRYHHQTVFLAENLIVPVSLNLSVVDQKFFFIKRHVLKRLIGILTFLFYGVKFGWIFRYSMVGYNFTFRNSRKKNLLKLSLGYSRHKIVICVPKSISFCAKGRRRLAFFGSVFQDFFRIFYYLFHLRNITPYKLRGLVLENAHSSVLKPGKKVKFK